MDMSIRFPNLNLGFDFVPKSIYIFGFEITIYGILIAVGMLLGIAFIVLEAKRCNQNQDAYLDMVILSLIASVVGARLFYVCFSWDLYKGNIIDIFDTRSGGMAFYGALLGGVIAAAVFCRVRRLPFWQMADIASMGILVGQIIGRWGNFFNRESFGEYSDGLFAMQLPLSAVRTSEVTSQMREKLITDGGISYIQVHPVFLYESVWCLLLLLFLLAMRRRKRFQGELFMRYLAGYGLGRFFFEYLRTDQLLIPGTRISVSLIVSALLFIVFGITVMVRCTMVKKRAAVKRRRRAVDYEQSKQSAGENTEEQEPLENTAVSEEKEPLRDAKEWENTDVPGGAAEETSEAESDTVPEMESESEPEAFYTVPGIEPEMVSKLEKVVSGEKDTNASQQDGQESANQSGSEEESEDQPET